MDIKQALEEYREILAKMQAYDYALSLANWDLETLSPPKGKAHAARNIGILAGESYSLKVSPRMGKILEAFSRHREELSPVRRRELELLSEEIEKLSKIPKEEYQEYTALQSTSQFVWQEAREKNDFGLFSPYLTKIIGFTRRFAGLTKPSLHPYEACLDDYEKKLTMEELDRFFGAVREKAVPLVDRIAREGRPIRDDFIARNYPADRQKAVSLRLMEALGFDLEGGIIAVSAHPFTCEINEGDIRLTTHYHENNLTSAILSTVHEVGHGLYEQHAKASPDLADSLLRSGVSMGIHESQSRFYENRICRSQAFWEYFYPVLQAEFPQQLEDVTLEELYRAINIARPGFIRIEADELTYNLHIMVRYELEKLLLEETVQVEDLPRLWNEKYQEYLGITPRTDAEGVLQDIHWAGGMIGYFPSYALGNAYWAQLNHTMKKSMDIDALCRKGDFAPIGRWLEENIHRHGMLKTPGELIVDATGEALNPRYLTDYLEKKFTAVYF